MILWSKGGAGKTGEQVALGSNGGVLHTQVWAKISWLRLCAITSSGTMVLHSSIQSYQSPHTFLRSTNQDAGLHAYCHRSLSC
jgi:hypothetical protein